MRRLLAVGAVLSLWAVFAMAAVHAPEAHARIWFPSHYHSGAAEARKQIRDGRPHLKIAPHNEWPPSRAVEPQLGWFDSETRLAVLPTWYMCGTGPAEFWAGEDASDLGHDRVVHAEFAAGRLDAFLLTKPRPDRAEILRRLGNVPLIDFEDVDGGPAIPQIEGDRFRWNEDGGHFEDTQAEEFGLFEILFIPRTTTGKYLLDDDGVTLYFHDVDEDVAWCIDLHQRCVIQRATPEGEDFPVAGEE